MKREQEFIDFIVGGCHRELAEDERAKEEAKQQAEVATALHLEGPSRDPRHRDYIALVERAAHLLGLQLPMYVRQVLLRQAARTSNCSSALAARPPTDAGSSL